MLLRAILIAARDDCADDVLSILHHSPSEVAAVDSGGWSALHWALRSRNARIADALLQAGADVNSRADLQNTPLHILMMSCGWTPGHAVALRDCCALLLAGGADVDAVDTDGNTPLHKAVWYCSVNCAAQLLAAGANINCKNVRGRTPADFIRPTCPSEMGPLLAEASAAAERWSGLRRTALTLWCSCVPVRCDEVLPRKRRTRSTTR